MKIITSCLLQSPSSFGPSFKINILIVRTAPPHFLLISPFYIIYHINLLFSPSPFSPRPHQSSQPTSYLSFTP